MFVHPAGAGVNTLWDMTRARLRTAIRAAMRDAQIPTVTELVKRAQVARNTVYNWEGGITAPALDELDKVAAALGVPLSVLVDAWADRETANEPPPEWARALEAKIVDELEQMRGVLAGHDQVLSDAVDRAIRRLATGGTSVRSDGDGG